MLSLEELQRELIRMKGCVESVVAKQACCFYLSCMLRDHNCAVGTESSKNALLYPVFKWISGPGTNLCNSNLKSNMETNKNGPYLPICGILVDL